MERGRAVPLGHLCDRHWNEAVRVAAAADGSRWLPEDDPDDIAFHEPLPCEDCGAPLTYHLTNYGRWIALEAREAPAKTVPSRFRWRLQTAAARNSGYAITVTALHLAGVEPRPDEPVRPAHRAVCPAPGARQHVHDEHLRDLQRARRRHEPPDRGTATG